MGALDSQALAVRDDSKNKGRRGALVDASVPASRCQSGAVAVRVMVIVFVGTTPRGICIDFAPLSLQRTRAWMMPVVVSDVHRMTTSFVNANDSQYH
jgi:hypothetical protein